MVACYLLNEGASFSPNANRGVKHAKMTNKREPVRWHIYLAELYQLLLSPHGVIVETESEALKSPPRADIILIRREGDHWTEAQRAFLPDGIRDTDASHILIEFKKTESLSAG